MRKRVPIVLLVLAVSLLAGCGAMPVRRNAGEPALAEPVIAPERAKSLLTWYTEINNRADKLRDERLLETYETGSSLELDRVGYRVSRKLDPKNAEYQPTEYASPELYVPRQRTYPRWFLVQAQRQVKQGDKESSARVWLVFARETAAQPWRQAMAPEPLTEESDLPDPAKSPYGFLTPVTRSDEARLAFGVDQAMDAHAGYLSEGPKSQHAASFEPDDVANGIFAEVAKKRGKTSSVNQVSRGAYPHFAVRTEDGGALAFYTLRRTWTSTIAPGWQWQWKGPLAVLSGGQTYRREITANYLYQFVTYIPPKGQSKMRVVGVLWGPVSAGGS